MPKKNDKYTDVMLDLETMGTGADAPIVSIGAVAFNLADEAEEDRLLATDITSRRAFYMRTSLESAVKGGAVVDPATVVWWLGQGDDARRAICESEDSAMDMPLALNLFRDYIAGQTVGPHNVRVWGNGAAFDNVILGETYRRAGLMQPWKFWNDHCYRTVKNLNKDRYVHYDALGTPHHAFYDALSQAVHLLRIHHYQEL